MGRRSVDAADRLPVRLSLGERSLVLEETLASPELTARLRLACLEGRTLVVNYTLSEFEELSRCVAEAINSETKSERQAALRQLFTRLVAIEQEYENKRAAPSSSESL